MTGSDFEELEGEGRSVLLNFNITKKEITVPGDVSCQGVHILDVANNFILGSFTKTHAF